MSELDLTWLAGLLEGEGSFMASPPSRRNKPVVSVEMTDQDVVDRVALLVGVKRISTKPRNGWTPTFSVRVTGTRAVNLMYQLRPLMGQRRQSQIDSALASFNPIRRRMGEDEINEAVKSLQDGESVKSVAERLHRSRRTITKLRDELVPEAGLEPARH